MKETRVQSRLRRYAAKIGAEELLTPEVEAGAHLAVYKAGQSVMAAGDEIHQVLVLAEGVCLIYSISERGKLGIVAHSTPPQMLGDIEYMQGLRALHSVQAETDVVFISFPISIVRQYLSHNIAFYRLICNNLIGKLYHTSGAYSRSLLYPARNRVARYILERAGREGLVSFRTSEAADALGITPRHISRIITSMEQEDILRRERPKVLRITNPEALTVLADLL